MFRVSCSSRKVQVDVALKGLVGKHDGSRPQCVRSLSGGNAQRVREYRIVQMLFLTGREAAEHQENICGKTEERRRRRRGGGVGHVGWV